MRGREVFFQKQCNQKEKEYQELLNDQIKAFEEMERLRDELTYCKSESKSYQSECQKLKGEIEVKASAIANLKTELDNRLAEATRNEINPDVREQTTPQLLQQLIDSINKWKGESRETRDWTKANKMITELLQLIPTKS